MIPPELHVVVFAEPFRSVHTVGAKRPQSQQHRWLIGLQTQVLLGQLFSSFLSKILFRDTENVFFKAYEALFQFEMLECCLCSRTHEVKSGEKNNHNPRDRYGNLVTSKQPREGHR